MLDRDEQDKQAEFFEDLPQGAKRLTKRIFSLGRIAISLSYENLILLTIGLIMTLIVCYSLGVEKGKYLVQVREEEIKQVQEKIQPATEKESVEPTEPKKEIMRVKLAQQPVSPAKSSPYIQVASFRTDKYATKEMQQLKERGYQPFTLSWGKYKVVCVGGYNNKNEAKNDLMQLKKLYADCILRNRK